MKTLKDTDISEVATISVSFEIGNAPPAIVQFRDCLWMAYDVSVNEGNTGLTVKYAHQPARIKSLESLKQSSYFVDYDKIVDFDVRQFMFPYNFG